MIDGKLESPMRTFVTFGGDGKQGRVEIPMGVIGVNPQAIEGTSDDFRLLVARVKLDTGECARVIQDLKRRLKFCQNIIKLANRSNFLEQAHAQYLRCVVYDFEYAVSENVLDRVNQSLLLYQIKDLRSTLDKLGK